MTRSLKTQNKNVGGKRRNHGLPVRRVRGHLWLQGTKYDSGRGGGDVDCTFSKRGLELFVKVPDELN